MSGIKKLAKDIVEPIEYPLAKLSTPKKKLEGIVIKVSDTNANPSTETTSIFFCHETNQRPNDRTVVVYG